MANWSREGTPLGSALVSSAGDGVSPSRTWIVQDDAYSGRKFVVTRRDHQHSRRVARPRRGINSKKDSTPPRVRHHHPNVMSASLRFSLSVILLLALAPLHGAADTDYAAKFKELRDKKAP